ncbi:hypothetical protein A4G99_03680 [Haladaptatus sp. R4]|uniref:lamin tail domain-containing protein n=1 Tax=Haladaptatus sp. R4 TaxID=1679489 RepID=UPI0007B48B34|nr:lamin tail domain-containing protein [Haladaptatus sp. R4]KZN25580.1 hypothetical protein A4G99_03680 [Haladaptatus sp. R4]
MEPTRRTVLAGIGATLAIGGGATQAFGQQDGTPAFKVLNVSATEDTITFYNDSSGSVDLSGWTVDFEYGNDSVDQTGTIPSGTTVGSGGIIKIASGAVSVDDADVVVQPSFDERVIERNRSDVIALLDSNGNEVANSEDDMFGGGSGGSGGGDDTSTTTDETSTTDESTTTTEEDTTTTSEETTTKETTTTSDETTTTDDTDGTTATTTDDGNETTTTSDETSGGSSDTTTSDSSSGSDSDISTSSNDSNSGDTDDC